MHVYTGHEQVSRDVLYFQQSNITPHFLAYSVHFHSSCTSACIQMIAESNDPHQRLLGIQQVLNTPIGNQRISTPANSILVQISKYVSSDLMIQIKEKGVYGVNTPPQKRFLDGSKPRRKKDFWAGSKPRRKKTFWAGSKPRHKKAFRAASSYNCQKILLAIMCDNQNIVSFIGLFYKRDIYL